VLDVNVLIAALLARNGARGRLLLRWLAGDCELIVSENLLAELSRALSYKKVRPMRRHGGGIPLKARP
jgi:predicted nucleic acid-binding protein